MDPEALDIDPDITRARTLPGEVYTNPEWFAWQRERLFARSWHLVPHPLPERVGDIVPWVLLPGALDEPVILTRGDDQRLRCLSNVCTHRGNVLVERPCRGRSIRCGYHGRRFGLDGRVMSSPGFETVEDFPRPSEHLPELPLETWEGFAFVGLAPTSALADLVAPVTERVGFLPFDRLDPVPEHSRHYDVAANWALYCDNYLEGLHIPFVHPGLNQALDFDAYRTELLPLGVLQIGIVKDPADAFVLPDDHPDAGQRVGGYYFFLFPCTMVNVYPWGLSINVVTPQGPDRTRVTYLTYTWDRARYGTGAGADLDTVEYEDEGVVERTARGVRSRLYHRGHYSPVWERGVHHFHRLLVGSLTETL